METYDLFLTSGILVEEAPISNGIKELIEKGQYEKAIRLLIYSLMFDINNYPIYAKIARKKIFDCINILSRIDLFSLDDKEIIKKFISLVVEFHLYSLENKLDLVANKEKNELIKAKLRELANIIQE